MAIRLRKIVNRSYKNFSFKEIQVWLFFLVITISYAVLIVPTAGRLGIGWDEATDLVIAQAYETPKGMLLGMDWDPSQTRLPMFIVALVFRLLGSDNLLIARYTTVFVGALTILGIFIYGKSRFNSITGLLAAGLLAINPFFLSFARLAFTESDMYLACSLTWLLVVFSRFQERQSLGWAVLSGFVLSLAISSKATAIVVVPVVCLSLLINKHLSGRSDAIPKSNALGYIRPRVIWFWCGWATFIIFVGLLVSRKIDVDSHDRIYHLFNYVIVFLGWLLITGWAVRKRNYTSHPIAISAFMACMSILTFVIFPPEHLGNSRIIWSVVNRADVEMTFDPGFILELAALHTFSIFLKSTPIIGFGLLAGLFIAYSQWRRPELTLPLLISTIYFMVILILPLGQTFYTVPLLPILSLLTADQLSRLWLKQRRIFIALILIGLIWWGMEIKQCYPDYHLNGYQWVGERPIFGRSSMGYRSIVFVPLDGTQQIMEWLNNNVKPDQNVQLYVGPPFIVESLAPEPAYQIVDGVIGNLDLKPDYVALQIGSTLWLGTGNDTPQDVIFRYPLDMDILRREYRKVFSLQRAFDLEVASVWQRK